MKRAISTAVSLVLVCVLALATTGCTIPFLGTTAPADPEYPTLSPVIASPAIIEDGYLTVGLDYSYAPYAGETNGQVVGIDADIAAALAQELGLKVKYIDVGEDGGPDAVASGKCDIFMNYERETAKNSKATYVATYIKDAPSLFAITSDGQATKVDLSTMTGKTIAAQSESVSSAQVQQLYGTEVLSTTDNLQDAFGALESHKVDYCAASGVVGSYIATSYSDIAFAGALTSASEIGIGASSANPDIQTYVNDALTTIQGNGVLDLIISKWIGAPLDLGTTTSDGASTTTGTTSASSTGTTGNAPTATTAPSTESTTTGSTGAADQGAQPTEEAAAAAAAAGGEVAASQAAE